MSNQHANYQYGGFGLILALLTVGCQAGVEPGHRVMIFAATSTTDAMEEIRAEFQQQTGVDVKVNFAASSTLAKQILSGARPDLYVSANASWVDAIGSEGHVAERVDLLGNQLVMIAAKDSTYKPSEIGELLDERVKRVSIADPDSVPAGIYAKQALTELGQWQKIQGKILSGSARICKGNLKV